MEDPRKGLFKTTFVLRIQTFSFCRKQNVPRKKLRTYSGVVGGPVNPFTLTPMGLGGARNLVKSGNSHHIPTLFDGRYAYNSLQSHRVYQRRYDYKCIWASKCTGQRFVHGKNIHYQDVVGFTEMVDWW
jgi:hypothetical protein